MCHCHLPEDMSDLPILPHSRHQLFLAVKEGLNNILKHAAATKVNVTITLPKGGMCVELTDNGRGFDPARVAAPGDGLSNMRERMKLVGGSLSITSRPASGTRLGFEIPPQPEAPALTGRKTNGKGGRS